jgi:hypothetical protein
LFRAGNKKGCIAAPLLYLTKYGSPGPQAQLAVVRWLAAVLLETPAHPTGLFSPRKADNKKPDQWPGFLLYGSACWARTSDPMINSRAKSGFLPRQATEFKRHF